MTNDEAADAPRILALLDALTAAEQRELELLKEQTAWRLHRDVAESIAKYWMDKDDAAGNEIAQLRAALTAKDEALADVADCKHYVTTLVVKNNLWRDGMDAREMVYALAFANDKATEEALTRADHHEAESARLTFERNDLAREVSRRIDENIVSMNEHARLTAQVTELQRQLAEADAGADIRAYERTVKEQSSCPESRIPPAQAHRELLECPKCVDILRTDERIATASTSSHVALRAAERRAEAAEAQVTRLTEQLDRIAPMVCPECGPHVRVDEDGCCATCGADAALAPATPPATERCACGHPGDTPTCPIDHDQIQHDGTNDPDPGDPR